MREAWIVLFQSLAVPVMTGTLGVSSTHVHEESCTSCRPGKLGGCCYPLLEVVTLSAISHVSVFAAQLMLPIVFNTSTTAAPISFNTSTTVAPISFIASLSVVEVIDPGGRRQCTTQGCQELIAPTMWRIHMGRHETGALPGPVLEAWPFYLPLLHWICCH